MKRLIPILTGKENDPQFIKEVTDECDKLILLHVVQREEVEEVPAGFAGSRIKKGEDIMEEIAEEVGPYLEVEINMEWGELERKLLAVAKINNVDEIWMKKSKQADELQDTLKDREIEVRVRK